MPTENNRGPRGDGREGARNREGAARLCLWTQRIVSTPEMYQEVKAALGVIFAPSLWKVEQQVSYRSATVRWDLFVNPLNHLACLERLSGETARRHRWYVRKHRSFHEREALRAAVGRADARSGMVADHAENRRLHLVSLNVAGYSSKKSELGLCCMEDKVDVLCLQETLWQSRGWQLKFPGYSIMGTEWDRNVRGARGVALAVRNGYLALDAGETSPWCVFARILHNRQMIIVGSVYLPGQKGKGRREAVKAVKEAVIRLRSKYPNLPMLIGGDWNEKREAVASRMASWNTSLVVREVSGADETWHRGAQRSAIDHWVVTQNWLERTSKARVVRSWDISDHWSIGINVESGVQGVHNQVQSGEETVRRPLARLDKAKLHEKFDQIYGHNRFAALASSIEAEPPSFVEGVQAFVEVSEKVAEEVGVIEAERSEEKSRKYRLSWKAIRAIRRRRRMAAALDRAQVNEGTDPADLEHLVSTYEAAKKEAKELIQRDKRISWETFIARGVQHLQDGEYGKFWRWIRTVSGKGRSRTKGVAPVRDEQGELQCDPEVIKQAWARHYGRLCRDETGHSRDETYWADKLTGPPREELEGINEPVTWPELCTVLKGLKNGKAPGISGLPAEWLKVCFEKDSEHPTSPMGAILLGLIRHMVEQGEVPEVLNRAVVVSIPKKGDLTLMDNYRGISLMETLLKVACTLVIRRVSQALEREKILVPEQAGFRRREECAGQIVSLYEIVRRRQVQGKPTYIAFLDFRKAYDTVPHQALMAKLRHVGVQGMVLRFIEAVYQDSKLSVLLPCGRTPEVQLLRGSRQGCPMSPILFDVFINDLFEECREYGVEVAGLERLVPGLLFADDAALLAGSVEDLRRMLDAAGNWAEVWEMSFGIDKCGVMAVNGSMEQLAEAQLSLQGARVPVVEEYTYLGIPLDYTWDLSKVVQRRVRSAEKAVQAVRGVLTSASIPMVAKVAIVRQCLLPVICYGGELLGMSDSRVEPLQRVLNEALRWIAKGGRSGISLSTLCRELRISSVSSTMSAARARAFKKFPTLATLTGELTDPEKRPNTGRLGTWVKGSRTWVLTHGGQRAVEALTSGAVNSHRRLARVVKKAVADREWRHAVQHQKSARQYDEGSYSHTNGYIKAAAAFPQYSLGIRELVRYRIRSVWTGERAAKAGLIDERYEDKCPCCERNVPETLQHIVCRCDRWMNQRKELILRLPMDFRAALRGIPDDRRLELLLGGGEDETLRELWLEGGVDGTDGPDLGWVAVARFLQDIYNSRNGLLWRTSTLPTMNLGPNG